MAYLATQQKQVGYSKPIIIAMLMSNSIIGSTIIGSGSVLIIQISYKANFAGGQSAGSGVTVGLLHPRQLVNLCRYCDQKCCRLIVCLDPRFIAVCQS